MRERKRIWRIMQKPPVAYEMGILLLSIYAAIFVSSPGAAAAATGGIVLLAGWWFFERGSTYNKRLQERDERIKQLENN
jgi:hypothetical protein